MKGPLLVVFDINGTLIERLKNKIEINLAKMHPNFPPVFDFSCRGAKCILRPHIQEFLQFATTSNQVHFAVWTSAQPENATALVSRIFGDYASELEFVWDRTRCAHAPMNKKSSRVLKDLSLIWKSKQANSKGIWSPTNTLLIDDTPSKSRKTPDNALSIPSFTFQTNDGTNPMEDRALLDLIDWLKMLPSHPEEDIRSIVSKNRLFK